MGEFIIKESFMHLFAKNLLVRWLKEAEKDSDLLGFSEFCGIEWRKGDGVFSELPFYETSDPYYFEISGGLLSPAELIDRMSHPLFRGLKSDHISLFKSDFDRGRLLFIPDIVIFHKGTPKYIIEIEYKNPVTPNKINLIADFFRVHSVEIITIHAEQILQQCEKPKNMWYESIQI